MSKSDKIFWTTALVLGVILAALCNGCATSGKVLATTATTVDSAMQGWATYVVIEKPAPDVEAKVKAAYGKWQAAQFAAEAAWYASIQTGDKTVWRTASDALRASQAELLALIDLLRKDGK